MVVKKKQTQQYGFEDPKTVYEMYKNVNSKNYVLPAIQRKFVWKESQIEDLFDSLMLGYPIGTFLVWQANTQYPLTNKYYECVSEVDYNFSFANNKELEPNEYTKSYLLLDGQQRLTSINIALNGYIIKNTKSDECYLYFNHLTAPKLNKDDYNKKSYEFKFLTRDEGEKRGWFAVKNIKQYFNNLDNLLKLAKNNPIATKNLNRLYNAIFEERNLYIYKLAKNSTVYDVLSVFSRLNSSGTKLSTPNLIFSVLASRWPEARNKVDELLTEINKKDFKFLEDYVIKVALLAIDKNCSLNLEKFTNDDADNIKDSWNAIKSSVKQTINLISNEYYMNKYHILSENALVIINYYIYKKLIIKQANSRSNKNYSEFKYKDLLTDEEIDEIKKFLVFTQTVGIFSSKTNKIVDDLCKIVDNIIISKNTFKLSYFYNVNINNKKYVANKDYIQSLFKLTKGKGQTFLILSLFYPNISIKASEKHQDHLHPEKFFKGKTLKKTFPTANDDELKFYQNEYNCLANLHFLDGAINSGEKNDTPLDEWLQEDPANPTKVALLPYMNEINDNNYENLKISNFKNFIRERKKLMRDKLKEIFEIK